MRKNNYDKKVNFSKGDGEMNITDQARDVLKQLLKENDAKNIRVYFMGIS
jgi:hypothetical protein